MSRLLALCFALAASDPFIYPLAPGALVNTNATLTVDGHPTPIEWEPGSPNRSAGPPPLNSSYARWAADATTKCDLKLRWAAPPPRVSLRAAGRDVDLETHVLDDGVLHVRFSLAPDHYVLKINDRRFYFWVDPLDAAQPPKGLLLQPAARRGDWLGGALRANSVVVLAAGEHRSAPLALPAGSTLFLAAGAVLRRDGSTGAPFLNAAEPNATIAGVGTVDASGAPGSNLVVNSTSSFAGRHVFFKNSGGWAVHVFNSSDCAFDAVKVFSGADGFDPDSSTNVSLSRVFVHSWDDAVAVKATRAVPTTSVSVESSLLATRKTAMKVGTETEARFSDIRFRSTDAFDSSRGLAIFAKDGGTIAGVAFEDVTVGLHAFPEEKEDGRPLDFELEHRDGYSTLHDVAVRRATLEARAPLTFKGNANATLRGVRLEDTMIHARAPAGNESYLVRCLNDDIAKDGVLAANMTVAWDGHEDEWLGLAEHPMLLLNGEMSLCGQPLNATDGRRLRMTLYRANASNTPSCGSDAKAYVTPLGACYSPAALFPHDPQWGAFDVRDAVARDLTRRFFNSTDGTCAGATDHFRVPLDTC
eukprot:CAMPEP_0119278108 /NCGR_PEP_ID=MMETSP1329-20130426/18482_1 /TAXON_ID=114041 /ORGANISM="Genus nov. species nov., Strain RCC1024" /LENGTH=586 /DNA_ID=CAMNT_0007278611 /DNA_START=83 /DNA_END=1840 /DNA_ORIENTATION=-